MGPGNFSGRVKRILGNLIALPQLLWILNSGRFDLVHVHSIACGIGAIAARLSNVPHIWHLHEPGPYANSDDRPIFDIGESLSIALANWTKSRFVAVSASVARLFEQKFELSEIGVLYQSISTNPGIAVSDMPTLEQITNWSGRKLVIVGALQTWKDQKTAVHALPTIIKDSPGTGLFLIGDDSVGLGYEIDALARELGVSDNVFRLGTMANATPAIAAADACIVTALDEGFGRVAVEAMLSKTSVISADVTVNREVAGDGNVDFFEPSDPQSLAATVSKVFKRSCVENDKKLTRALIYASEKFSLEVAADALETELLACLNRQT